VLRTGIGFQPLFDQVKDTGFSRSGRTDQDKDVLVFLLFRAGVNLLEQLLHRPFLSDEPLFTVKERIVEQLVSNQLPTAILDGRFAKMADRVAYVLVRRAGVPVGVLTQLFDVVPVGNPAVQFVKSLLNVLREFVDEFPGTVRHNF